MKCSKMKIAVEGAGVAGAFCSNSLRKMGAAVTVFEAGRGPGVDAWQGEGKAPINSTYA